jgi:hypothetical protein
VLFSWLDYLCDSEARVNYQNKVTSASGLCQHFSAFDIPIACPGRGKFYSRALFNLSIYSFSGIKAVLVKSISQLPFSLVR